MATHTPGPWRYDWEPGYCGELLAANGTSICTFADEPKKEDARLIAAAPDLLEALLAMEQEKSDYMTRNNLGDPSIETTNKVARAAIAKATGA